MAMKTANEDVYFRIKSAGALKAAGIRLNNSDMRLQGEQAYAAAFVENAILVHNEHLTPEARSALARLLFDAPPQTDNADEDVTADAEETTQELEAEARALGRIDNITAIVPPQELDPETLYDPDDEHYDDEDEEYDEDLEDEDDEA